MTKEKTARGMVNRIARTVMCVVALVMFAISVTAQTTKSPFAGLTPAGLTPGAPAGAFPLSGFENVNLFNGNLNFNLPLVRVAGRGGASVSLNLPIEQHWHVDVLTDQSGGEEIRSPSDEWWNGFKRIYEPGFLVGRTAGDVVHNCFITQGRSIDIYVTTLTRLTFTAPDGTEYELRDLKTAGQPKLTPDCPGPYVGFNRGRVFVTSDGTSATFISATDIIDSAVAPAPLIFPTGDLFMSDGTLYHIEEGLIRSIRDRNGNTITFTYDYLPNDPATLRLVKITDSLNRLVTIDYDVDDGFPYGRCDRIKYNGFGGVQRIIRVSKDHLQNILRTTQPGDESAPRTFHDLFPNLNGSSFTTYRPLLTSAVWLPNGRAYKFFYNVYAELARVELPTGGAYEYDFRAGVNNTTPAGEFPPTFKTDYIYRRVIERRVYSDSTTLETRQTFSRPETYVQVGPDFRVDSAGFVQVDESGGDGVLLSRSRHYFFYDPSDNYYPPSDISYTVWNFGKEYKTELFDKNGATVLRTTSETWNQSPVSWWPAGDAQNSPQNNPRVTDMITALETNQVTRQHFDYDQYNNRTDVYEYDFGSGSPGSLLRRTHTNYITTNNGISYDTINPNTTNPDVSATVHLRSLPLAEIIYEGGTAERARVTYEYDNYIADTNHAPLIDRAGISGHDASFTTSKLTRGNVTRISRFLNTGGTIDSHLQYDIAGNSVKSIDPRGNATTVGYSSTFSFSYPTEVTVPIPDPTGVNGSSTAFTSFANYDVATGLVTSLTDENGQVTIPEYNDSLDRLTRIVRPTGGGSTTYVYSDTPGNLFLQTQTTQSSSQTVTSDQVLDGLGRPTTSRLYAPEGVIISTQNYDGMGRVKRTTNPYTSTSDPTYGTTETTYDGLSRVTRAETFDGFGASTGVVRTDYSGSRVLVTDQAGKQRISATNAIGQMSDIWEICPADSATVPVSFPNRPEVTAGYRTTYGYDALDDLTSVMQRVGTSGTLQTRTFIYDSLKRLKQAINPESFTITYEYDNNGNLKQRTDARGIRVDYSYDGLNRPISRSYTDGTPAVTYKYDGAGVSGSVLNLKGRLTLVTSSVSSCRNDEYDAIGRVLKCTQQTAGQSYLMSYEYDLAGNMISQTYPGQTYTAGRKVHTAYDTAGRIAGITAQKTGEQDKIYSSSYSYAPHGAVSAMTLGNNLVQHTSFNSRLQPLLIGLGGAISDSSKLKLEYTYGNASNNGNILSQKITIPGLSQSLYQSYAYDALNRLQDARESLDTDTGLQSWRQRFIYDRFGNRNFDTVLSTIVGQNPTISQANNRIDVAANPAYGYDPAGNMTKQPGGSTSDIMVYDAENRQIRFTSGQTGAITTYEYDGDGRRVKRVSGAVTTVFVYNVLGQLVAEYDNSTSPPQGSGGTSYLTTDHLGSTRIITSQDQSVKARNDYLPFGEEIQAEIGGRTSGLGYIAGDIRQRFTQKERDLESGLDYFLARYYSSAGGRFTSVDPIPVTPERQSNPQTLNLYLYATNNPLAFLDPTGMDLVRLGQHSDDEIKRRLGEIATELNKEGITNKQKQALEKERNTLQLEQEGNRVVGDALKKLESSGQLNNLKLSDFTLSTDPKKDFRAMMRQRGFSGSGLERELAKLEAPGTAGVVFRGQSSQIFVLRTAGLYQGYLAGGGGTLVGAGEIGTNDIAIIISTNLRHEQYHRDRGRSEVIAYQTQLEVLNNFGPGAFINKRAYEVTRDFLESKAGNRRRR